MNNDQSLLRCTERVEKLENALFMVGEIGWNDYNYAIFQGKPMEELREMVPDVVAAIMDAARKVINRFGRHESCDSRNLPDWLSAHVQNGICN